MFTKLTEILLLSKTKIYYIISSALYNVRGRLR